MRENLQPSLHGQDCLSPGRAVGPVCEPGQFSTSIPFWEERLSVMPRDQLPHLTKASVWLSGFSKPTKVLLGRLDAQSPELQPEGQFIKDCRKNISFCSIILKRTIFFTSFLYLQKNDRKIALMRDVKEQNSVDF